MCCADWRTCFGCVCGQIGVTRREHQEGSVPRPCVRQHLLELRLGRSNLDSVRHLRPLSSPPFLPLSSPLSGGCFWFCLGVWWLQAGGDFFAALLGLLFCCWAVLLFICGGACSGGEVNNGSATVGLAVHGEGARQLALHGQRAVGRTAGWPATRGPRAARGAAAAASGSSFSSISSGRPSSMLPPTPQHVARVCHSYGGIHQVICSSWGAHPSCPSAVHADRCVRCDGWCARCRVCRYGACQLRQWAVGGVGADTACFEWGGDNLWSIPSPGFC